MSPQAEPPRVPAAPAQLHSAVVVGGTRRIGRWVSTALGASGRAVHALYRSDHAAAAQLKTEAEAAGWDLQIHQADALDAAALHKLLDQLAAAAGSIDILVNSAGPSAQGRITDSPADVLSQLWAGNVLSVHHAVLAALPHMPSGGRIISFVHAGADSIRAYRDVALYATCKTALVVYSRSLARELQQRGITVNCIALGITTQPAEGAPDMLKSAQRDGYAIGADDVAAAVRYLVSPGTAQLTGTVLNLSGGFAL